MKSKQTKLESISGTPRSFSIKRDLVKIIFNRNIHKGMKLITVKSGSYKELHKVQRFREKAC
jgi:hypothetical protein